MHTLDLLFDLHNPGACFVCFNVGRTDLEVSGSEPQRRSCEDLSKVMYIDKFLITPHGLIQVLVICPNVHIIRAIMKHDVFALTQNHP